MQHRKQRVADAIKDAVASIVLKDIADPKLGFVTVTRCSISKDLRIATVYFSVLGNEDEQQASIERLERARGFVRRHLRQYVFLRYLPELRFRLDDILAHERRVGALLDEISQDTDDSTEDEPTGGQ
ncbi:MAG: 30S ribosome-binding factor RbfA [candidate division WOR-3 bacterium]|nr:MAG: 30S ribosome-binding factor RbfA [candidate division WOR-3 bacterium]